MKKEKKIMRIAFIENKEQREKSFSKRKQGLIKKAKELATLTGGEILLIINSPTGKTYAFSTPKFEENLKTLT